MIFPFLTNDNQVAISEIPRQSGVKGEGCILGCLFKIREGLLPTLFEENEAFS